MNPPALATWLLERFEIREATIGDLIERFGAQPSRTWYWRQVFLAILAETVDDIRRHGFLAVRAVMTGFVVLVIFDRAVRDLLRGVSFHGAIWIAGHLFEAGQWVARPMWVASLPLGGVLAGWAVTRFHRRPMIGVFAGCFLTWQIVQLWLFIVVQRVDIQVGDYLVFSMLLLVSVLLGGLWTARHRHNRLRLG
jgi:hypothetical protein